MLTGLLLSACDSGPIPSAELVVASIVSCESPRSMLRDRIQYWKASIEKQPYPAAVRPNWEAEVDAMLVQYPGVLLKIHVIREATIIRDRSLGKAGPISVQDWTNVDRSKMVYSVEFGTDCAQYPLGRSSAFYLAHMGGSGLPPEHLAPFLGVEQMMRVPSPFHAFVPSETD